MNTITREELQTSMSNGDRLVLLEALPEKFYRHGHLPGAHLFPHDRAGELVPLLVPDRTTPIVVYCASPTCRNSHEAAATLSDMGYESVRVYAQGKADWVAAGLGLVR